MRNLLHRFRALSPSARLTALLCAGAVALCLILPPAVFAVWMRCCWAVPSPGRHRPALSPVRRGAGKFHRLLAL